MNSKKLSHPGNILLAGFGLMLLMMGILVFLSVKQNVSLVSKQYYEQELIYQQKIEASSNAEAFTGSFQTYRKGDLLLLSLPQTLTQHMEEGQAWFYCPANESMDRKIILRANETGQYTFTYNQFPGKGYLLKLSFKANGKSYYKEFNLSR